jgi:hypothetical protein
MGPPAVMHVTGAIAVGVGRTARRTNKAKHMMSLSKIFLALFVVAVLAGVVMNTLVPLAMLAAVAYSLLCVWQGLHR